MDLGFFDNREIAAIFWTGLFVLWAGSRRDVRDSVVSVLKAFLSPKLLVGFGVMAVYVGVLLSLSYTWIPWDKELTKASIVWIIGSAVVMFVNVSQANTNPNYFRETTLRLIGLNVFLGFVLDIYVLPLLIELILFPVLILLSMSLAVAGSQTEFKPAKLAIEWILGLLFLSLAIYSVVGMVDGFDEFASASTFRRFTLPVLLTLGFLPLIYLTAVFIGYEEIFLRIRMFVKDLSVASRLRKRVILSCHLNLRRLNLFIAEYMGRVLQVRTSSDVEELMTDFELTHQKPPSTRRSPEAYPE